MSDLVQTDAEIVTAPSGHPSASDWQSDQGNRCGCRGTDEYCVCQNIRKDEAGMTGRITETITFNFDSEEQQRRFHEKLSGSEVAPTGDHLVSEIFHKEQLIVWSEELLSELSDYLDTPQNYEETLDLHRRVENFLTGTIANAVTHALASSQLQTPSGHLDFEAKAREIVEAWDGEAEIDPETMIGAIVSALSEAYEAGRLVQTPSEQVEAPSGHHDPDILGGGSWHPKPVRARGEAK